jgi:hypothetical protein
LRFAPALSFTSPVPRRYRGEIHLGALTREGLVVTLPMLSLHNVVAAGTGNQLPIVIIIGAVVLIAAIAAGLSLKKS